jgi:DtxR family Mn-dependent transcriptional regulator
VTEQAELAARPTALAERYLEAIYYIEHEGEAPRPGRLAEWLGVSAPTATVSLQRLARDGWVQAGSDRSVQLTGAGALAAAEIVRRHRILERWLTDTLGLDWATADREAASLAHGVSPLVLDRIDATLGHPTTCPHGNVIPGRQPPRGGRLTRLVDLAPGGVGRVARISEVAEHDAPHLLATLSTHRLYPGAEIRVDGAQRFDMGSGPFALDDLVARAVWVVRQSD